MPTVSTGRRWLRRGLGTVAVLALFLGLVALHDRLTHPQPSYAPVEAASALDGWQEPWPAATGCGTTGPERWLVVGWDGAEWDLALPLVAAGRLPNLERLLREGAAGGVATYVPTVSPALWTTVATGVSPTRHGILGFYNRKPRLGRWWARLQNFGRLDRYLYSNADRRVPAVWNILGEHGRDAMLVGYHNTFPVEPIDGVMVSNYLMQSANADLMRMGTSGDDSFAASVVYPTTVLPEVLEIQEDVEARMPELLARFLAGDLSEEERLRYLRRARQMDREGGLRPYFLYHGILYDTVYAAVAEHFLERSEPAATFVHFQGIDWLSHHFLYFQRPEAFADAPWSEEVRQDLEAQLPLYRDIVAEMYVYLDEWLGRLIAAAGEDTAVLLLSDHGFAADDDPEIPGFHDEAPPGVLVMRGPGIRPGARLEGATLYDVLPTLMAALGLPVAEDLEGRVLDEAFCPGVESVRSPPRVATYGSAESYAPTIVRPPALEQELLDQLESLGYLR